jgi:biopolymer transport protein TolQ
VAYHIALIAIFSPASSKGAVVLLAQVSFWDLILQAKPVPMAVMGILMLTSLISWTIIFSKWSVFRKARSNNAAFIRMFRKAEALSAVAMVVEQFALSPLVSVFEFGYEEVDRQVKARGALNNKLAIERSLQLGVSEELAKLERNMNWLATTAAIAPFIGLFGTVWGIIDAFSALGLAGSASLRAVAPPIAEALFATALGLAAAIPAAIFYNHFSHVVKEIAARMDDFSLEFLNLAERTYGD